MSNVFLRLLKDKYKRNIIIDKYKYIWCPIKSSDFVNYGQFRSLGTDGRNFYQIIQYVYAPRRLLDEEFSNSDVEDWAKILLKFDQNRWLLDDFEKKVKKKYDTFLRLLDDNGLLSSNSYTNYITKMQLENHDDIISFSEIGDLQNYHDNGDMDGLVIRMIGSGKLKINPEYDNNIIYFRCGKTSNLDTSHKNRYIVKSYSNEIFFWLDVGTWSSPQNRNNLNGNAMIGVVTSQEVALFNIYASNAEIAKCRRQLPRKKSLAVKILDDLEGVFGGGPVFYYNLSSHGNIKTPVMDANEIIFVIPDLHLHLFKEFSADNFIEPWAGGKSLDILLKSVFTIAEKWQEKFFVHVIQVGDLYELWESAMLLLMSLNPDWRRLVFDTMATRINPMKVKKYLNDLHNEALKRGYDKKFSESELDNLAKLAWDDSSLKDVWQKIQEETEKQYEVMFKQGKDRRFGKGKFDTYTNQKIISGNHDSFIGNPNYVEMGINNVIRVEHLHYNDPFNKPENMIAGQFMTILNLIAETRGIGDQAKNLENSRRVEFIKDVTRINLDRYRKDHSMYGLIITGHTHRAYAGIISMKKSKSELIFKMDCKYDQGWQKDRSTRQEMEILGLAIINYNELLGGISAMSWRGFGPAIRTFIGIDNHESKPFQAD